MTEATLLERCTGDLLPRHLDELRTAVARERADDADQHRLAQIRDQFRRLGVEDELLERITLLARRQLRQRRVLSAWSIVAALVGSSADDIEEILMRSAAPGGDA